MMQGGLKVSTTYKYFHLQAWLCKVVLLTFMQDKYFSASNLGAAILVCNLPVKCKRGLANDLTHTSITHASLVHNITKTARHKNGWLMTLYTSATHASLVGDITQTARYKMAVLITSYTSFFATRQLCS